MKEPRIDRVIPVFGIASYEDAVAHYVDWLGFRLDWEWREGPGEPVIMALSRDEFSFMLNQNPGSPGHAEVTLHVTNLEGLCEAWNEKRPGAAVPRIGLPYEFPSLSITDPSDNTLTFHEDNQAELERRRAEVLPRMRAYIQKTLDAGHPLPTAEEVREAVGPVLGFAFEALNEFREHGSARGARKTDSE